RVLFRFGETNDTNKPGDDWEQVRGGDTNNNNNKRAHGINKQTQESTGREQGSTRTRQRNKHVTTQGRQTQKLNTDRTQTLHKHCYCPLQFSATFLSFKRFVNVIVNRDTNKVTLHLNFRVT